MDYIRVSTRLFCDIYEAYRALTNQTKISKWLPEGISYKITEMIPYQKVVWSVNDISFQMEFNIMNATSKTEFCSEIHLRLLKTGIQDDQAENMKTYAVQLLDHLRVRYNKDWVIEDKDLGRSILMD